MLLTEEEVGPAFTLVKENTGLRNKADYDLEEEEWEEFQWKEGFKITFENQLELNEDYVAVFNYNSRYLNQEVMFEEYKESKQKEKKFTVLAAPEIGEDWIAFFYSYQTISPKGEVKSWTELDLTFIKDGVYENIAILKHSSAMEIDEALANAVGYARILEEKIDQAVKN